MTAEAKPPKISIRGVKKAFGPKVVLDGIDLDVDEGESVVVVGGSGTGKSVLIKCILGILDADSGSIKIDGTEACGASRQTRAELIRKMGMLFQGGALFDSLPVWENVAFGLIEAKGMNRKAARPIALENLHKVGLADRVADLYPAELSGGMQKRVSLARAIATGPEIIFFDEPTTGLDPIMADVINRLIVERVKELGATTLTITHDMGSVRKIADRVAMLHDGKIIWQGPVADIDTTDNPYVQQFVFGQEEGPIRIGGAR
ncbi:MAG: ATP-binding cassette domain-containing protein [Alphaproteobacteria bacterium]|nr:ATP-binding cassette domain-containing protein [Alphaproteobacteria bacterium]